MKSHTYTLDLQWTGDLGSGTSSPQAYSRNHAVSAVGKPELLGSSDPTFRGDSERWNPEELLVASLAQCHMLWYLSLAASASVVVLDYIDQPVGTMIEESDGGGQFIEVTLNPTVLVADTTMVDKAHDLHGGAHDKCFIARSVNFPVLHNPTTLVDTDD
ncbi:organic hydroperoxide reductase OsmC/OhrA [Rhodococcus sp. 27YEA15]|uniref:OsmC family protein n=1 Tax=Rhodococcus sp. 27YEA15 TaxID=3156259 RepID=UPI003C7D6169